MNAREKTLIAVAAAAALSAAAWFLALAPALAWQADLRRDSADKEAQIAAARALQARGKAIEAKWGGRQAAGFADPADAAAARMMGLFTKAAADSGFSLGATSPGISSPDRTRPGRMVWRTTLSGHGTLPQTVEFLRLIEAAPAPLRIDSCNLESPDPSKDRLQLSVSVSTSHAKRMEKPAPAGAPATAPFAGSADLAATKAVLAAAPFGHGGAPRKTESRPTQKPVAPPPPPEEANWILVGIVVDDAPQAVFRHAVSGEVREVTQGEMLGRARILALSDERVQVAAAAGPRLSIHLGEALSIEPGQAQTKPSIPAASVPAPAAPTASRPASAASGAPEAPGTLSPEAQAVAGRVTEAILAANPQMQRADVPDVQKNPSAFMSFMQEHRRDYRDKVPREEVFVLYRAIGSGGGPFQFRSRRGE